MLGDTVFSFFKRLLAMLLCVDLTLGYTIDDDELYFKNFLFSKEINYTVHYLNLFPLTIIFYIIAGSEGEPDMSVVYLIISIYGPIHVGIV